MIAPLVVWRRGEDDFLLLTEPELGVTVRDQLDRARIASRCEIELEEHTSAIVFGDGGTGSRRATTACRRSRCSTRGLEASPPDEELERLRILARTPRWGREIDDGILPAEAGLDERAVSFTKGCYPGQEPLARLRNRGHVNRTLRVLELDGDAAAPGGRGALRGRRRRPRHERGPGPRARLRPRRGARRRRARGRGPPGAATLTVPRASCRRCARVIPGVGSARGSAGTSRGERPRSGREARAAARSPRRRPTSLFTSWRGRAEMVIGARVRASSGHLTSIVLARAGQLLLDVEPILGCRLVVDSHRRTGSACRSRSETSSPSPARPDEYERDSPLGSGRDARRAGRALPLASRHRRPPPRPDDARRRRRRWRSSFVAGRLSSLYSALEARSRLSPEPGPACRLAIRRRFSPPFEARVPPRHLGLRVVHRAPTCFRGGRTALPLPHESAGPWVPVVRRLPAPSLRVPVSIRQGEGRHR